MLTIENIKQLEGAQLPNGFIIERITIGDNIYAFQLGKQHTLYNPMTFQPEIKFYNKTFTLNRRLDDLNPMYMFTDEMGHYTWVNKEYGLKDTQSFIYKLNELTNLW